MKHFVIYLLMGTVLGSASNEWTAKWENMEGTHVERWEKLADEASSMPPDQRIGILSRILISDQKELGDHMIEIYKRIQVILLETEGHAQYYGDRIKENPRHPDRNRWLGYLKNLPSPETVRVLGEMLSDERGRPEPEIEELDSETWMLSPPVCHLAIKTLQGMLENPPVPAADDFREWRGDLETWRVWYERVKAGRHTFRFVGDPTHYTLRGPSKRGAIEPGPRDAKRNPSPSPTNGAVADPPSAATKYVPYLLGGIFLLAGFIFYLRGRGQHA